MKRILRHFIIDTYSLWLTSQFASGMVFENGIKTLVLAGICVTLVSVFAKPIINLLLIPINLISFGLFRWVGTSVVLYLVTLLVPAFKLAKFNYHGFSNAWIDIPAINVEGLFAFVAFSFVLSAISTFIYWLISSSK